MQLFIIIIIVIPIGMMAMLSKKETPNAMENRNKLKRNFYSVLF